MPKIGEQLSLPEFEGEIAVYLGQKEPGQPEFRGVETGQVIVLPAFPPNDSEAPEPAEILEVTEPEEQDDEELEE
jgi:hypothetical protein